MILGSLVVLYGLFWLWYGGRGKPLSDAETQAFIADLAMAHGGEGMEEALNEVRTLVANDDGREFVMQNLVRHRTRALYPEGSPYGDDPREADRRYGRLIIWPLLRFGSLPIFVAKRTGQFIQPEGADAWHYVAMVRYRSRRDFLRFARVIQSEQIVMHKWAAIEKTHVFPVQPMVSLFMVRTLVAGALLCIGLVLKLLAG